MEGDNPPNYLEDTGLTKLQGRKRRRSTSVQQTLALLRRWASARRPQHWVFLDVGECGNPCDRMVEWPPVLVQLLISLYLFFLCWPPLNFMDSEASFSPYRKQSNCHVIAVQRQQCDFWVYVCLSPTILHCRQSHCHFKPTMQNKAFALPPSMNRSRSWHLGPKQPKGWQR